MANNFGAARAAAKKRKLAHAAADLLAPRAPTDESAPVVDEAPPAKKTRTEHLSNLKWKSIVLPSEFGFDEDGGLLELDEVEGVDVCYGADGILTFGVRRPALTRSCKLKLFVRVGSR